MEKSEVSTKYLTAAESEMITFDVRPFRFTEAYAGFSCLLGSSYRRRVLDCWGIDRGWSNFVESTTSKDVGWAMFSFAPRQARWFHTFTGFWTSFAFVTMRSWRSTHGVCRIIVDSAESWCFFRISVFEKENQSKISWLGLSRSWRHVLMTRVSHATPVSYTHLTLPTILLV